MVQENDVVVDFDLKTRAFRPSKDGCPFRPDPGSDCARQRGMPPQLRKPCKERPSWVDFGGSEVSFHATVPGGEVIKDVERGKRTARVGRFTDGDLKRPLWVTSVGDDEPIAQPYSQLDVFERATGKHLGYVGWR